MNEMEKIDEFHTADPDSFSKRELTLAFRNHGIHYEALRDDISRIGQHYLLLHFDMPILKWDEYSLNVFKRTDSNQGSLSFTMNDIINLPKVSLPVTMECAGNGRSLMVPRFNISQPWDFNGVGTAIWSGVSLKHFLDICSSRFGCNWDTNAVEVLFTGKDKGIQHGEVQHYQRSLTIEELNETDAILAYEMNGQKLPRQHGFPLRLIVPGYYGMSSVKWLDRIEILETKFQGKQMTNSYKIRKTKDEIGVSVKWIVVRSMIVPPGIPDWFNRNRFVEEGPVLLEGRAWAGMHQIKSVKVEIDGTSFNANLEDPVQNSKYAWRRWTLQWEATKGNHTISVQATDELGNTQPNNSKEVQEDLWNYGGFMNNSVQTIQVIVKSLQELEIGSHVE